MEISFDTYLLAQSVSNALSHLSSPLQAFPLGKRDSLCLESSHACR